MEAKHELRRALDALQAAATAIEEQPDAELGVVKADVRPRFDGVGDFHEKLVRG